MSKRQSLSPLPREGTVCALICTDIVKNSEEPVPSPHGGFIAEGRGLG
jgi:hypothetical protein